MAFIDSTVVNVALPAIQARFHATVVDVQWVVESYGLFLGALILVGGSLGDLFGRRLVFVAGVAIFALASSGCGVATNIHQLILARSIQGVGAALLVPGSLAIISTSFDEKSRGQAIGTWSGFTAITTAVGPVLGGWLVEHASWRWAFFHQCPPGSGRNRNFCLAHSGKSQRFDNECRLGGSPACQPRFEWLGLRLHRIYQPRLGTSSGFWELGHRLRLPYWVRIRRGPCHFAHGPTRAIRVPQLHWREPAHAVSICSDWDFLFPVPSEPDTSSGILRNRSRRCRAPTDFADISSFPLVWRTRCALRRENSIDCRPHYCGVGLRSVRCALHWQASYWKAFFPAVVVLGFGMAVTVAPLTTVVMNSVGQDRVGTASGINNAVARVAGVLAIAVFGIVMVSAFSSRLNHSLAYLSLPPSILQKVQMEEIKLAGLQVPAGLDPGTSGAIKESIGKSFVFGFRIVMLICASLSAASAAVAWRVIRDQLLRKQYQERLYG